MKRIQWMTIAIFGLAGRALGDGHLTGAVYLTAGSGGSLSSYGFTRYDIYPPTHDNAIEQITGSHKVSYDSFGMGGLIAHQGFGPTRSYEGLISGNGAAGQCYRARVEANMPSRTNSWGSAQQCVDPPPPPPPPGGGSGGPYGWCDTPLVVDLDGDGLRLAGPEDPVRFDLTADGVPELITWTAAGRNEGFLAIDLNGNGRIDSGRELFGSQTVLPLTGAVGGSHGFRPLADYDSKTLGGNENSVIDPDDPVFSQLRIWIDRNHNGISEPGELSSLPAAGIRTIEYGYGFMGSRDEHGNVLWLEGQAWSDRGETKIYDVIFLYAASDAAPAPNSHSRIEMLEH